MDYGGSGLAPRHGPRRGAESPKVGVAYTVEVYAHGDVRFVNFGRRSWEAETPLTDPSRRPGPDGAPRYTGYLAGTMELLDRDHMRFTIVDPSTPHTGLVVLFRPTAAGPPPG